MSAELGLAQNLKKFWRLKMAKRAGLNQTLCYSLKTRRGLPQVLTSVPRRFLASVPSTLSDAQYQLDLQKRRDQFAPDRWQVPRSFVASHPWSFQAGQTRFLAFGARAFSPCASCSRCYP